MHNKKLEVFENYPIPKAVATLAIPTVLNMIVNIIYNMVDTFFVAQTGDSNQVAAVSLATPIYLLLMASGNIFGIGGSSFLSRSLGEKKLDRVKKISSFCFYGGIFVSLIMSFFFIVAMPVLLKWCGASENTYGFAKTYLTWIAYGSCPIVLSVIFSNLIRSEGSSKTAMFGMLVGTIVNIILDPIMIITLGWGISGAAIATVIGNICSIVFYLVYIIFGKRSILSLNIKHFSVKEGILKNVFSIGIPGSLNNVLMSLSNILLNFFLSKYGDAHVAAMGIAMKANSVVVFLQLGLGMGIQPLIGYSYGSKNYTRLRGTIKFSLVISFILGILVTAVYFLFTSQIISFFIKDPVVIESGVMMLRALMLAIPFLGIMFIFNFSFQAMGKAIPSLMLSLSRQGFVYLPLLLIGRALAGLNGIIYAQPIADIFSVIMSIVMFLYINKKMKE